MPMRLTVYVSLSRIRDRRAGGLAFAETLAGLGGPGFVHPIIC
jgi:hypothetical protein